jgi:hypothetical protein
MSTDKNTKADESAIYEDRGVPLINLGQSSHAGLSGFLAEAAAKVRGRQAGRLSVGQPSEGIPNYGRNFENYARNFENYARNFENYGRVGSMKEADDQQRQSTGTLPNGAKIPFDPSQLVRRS